MYAITVLKADGKWHRLRGSLCTLKRSASNIVQLNAGRPVQLKVVRVTR